MNELGAAALVEQWEEFVEAIVRPFEEEYEIDAFDQNGDLKYSQLQLAWKSWLCCYEKTLK